MVSVIGARIGAFLASKAVTIALLAALAAGGAYMYFEIKETGRLEARADELQRTLEQNEIERQRLVDDNAKRGEILTKQARDLSKVRHYIAAVNQRIRNAEAKASKALRDCMAMSLADGMQFGPSVQDQDGDADS